MDRNLENDIRAVYQDYRNRFLRSTPSGNWYIEAQGIGTQGLAATISEAHGYGMIIFALATWDHEAREIFDGMNQARKANPSTANPDLMSWVICESSVNLTSNVPADARGSSATDGDMDMAYALLLAHKRWGGDYKTQAIRIINAIKEDNFHPNIYRTKLGDWHNRWGNNPNNSTRSSDWMPAHFRAFHRATNDDFWLRAIDTVYSLLDQIADPRTGLVPCFLRGAGAALIPDSTCGGAFGEPDNCVNYSANACRVPWRIGADWIHNKEPRARDYINKLSNWLRTATGGSPNSIRDGYQLDGTPIRPTSRAGMHFVAPFAVGMVANRANQSFLNATWSLMATGRGNSYGMAIQLLSMLLITEIWEAPN